MADPEMIYSAARMTADLEMTPQMAGRYYQAFEKITKQKIKKLGRDGRQFDEVSRSVLLMARDIVRSSSGVTVEDALKKALALSSSTALEPVEAAHSFDIELLKSALAEAVAAPLIAEIRELRNSHEGLRRELVELQATRENRETEELRAMGAEVAELKEQRVLLPVRDTVIDDEIFYGYRIRDKDHQPEADDGPIVRLARRFERLFRRG